MTILNLPAVEIWTVEDLEGLPSELRYEIRNGKLVIMSPVRLWHEHVAAEIRGVLRRAGRHAFTNVGIKRTSSDTRVSDVAVFRDEPDDPLESWHEAGEIALVVEVWSPSSDDKDRNEMDWYARRGIPEYWLAEPMDGDKWGAYVTRFTLARATSGEATYMRLEATTLTALSASEGIGGLA